MARKSPPPTPVDHRLRQYATDNQWNCYVALCETGSKAHAARKLGLNRTTIQGNIRLMMKKAAQHGIAPEYDLDHEAAPGFTVTAVTTSYDRDGDIARQSVQTKPEGMDPERIVKVPDPKKIVKTSTYYKGDGTVTGQWVMEKPEDVEREKLWLLYAKELAANVERAEPVLQVPGLVNADLMAAYPVGDHHHGMLAWGRETRSENYDMKVSERLLSGGAQHLMQLTPRAGVCLIPLLGDFNHYDGFKPVTPTNQHILDADSRFPKMVSSSIRMIRHLIDAALHHHGRVHVIVEIGNHDMSSMVFMMELLANVYENEPRVTIDTSPSRYHYYEFGRVLIGTHHGDGAKPDKLPAIMATDMPEAWGRTIHRHWFTGHIHHDSRKDYTGATVESFRVLPPVDAWAAMKGYRSVQDMKAIVYHREYGEVERRTVNPAMIHAMTES